MRPRRSNNGPARLVSQPIRLQAWQTQNGAEPLAAMERDLCTLMRALAEARFANDEQNKSHQQATRDLLLSLLEVKDAFEHVFEDVDRHKDRLDAKMKKYLSNFQTVSKLLWRILQRQGVKEIINLEQGFDPHWHQIVGKVPDPSRVDGTILEVVRRGYAWQGKLLREAEVVVVYNGGGGTGC